MPLLGGLFSKKNKSSSRRNGTLAGSPNGAASDLDSALSSPTNSYVTADRFLPSSPNGTSYLHPNPPHDPKSKIYPSIDNLNPAPSSSRLRLPFGRKKSTVPVSSPKESATPTSPNFMPPPRPSFTERFSSGTASDTDSPDVRRLRPPPSKSAIFAAYVDPNNALSTRSLPDDRIPSYTSMHIPPGPLLPVKEKRPSLFSWTKSNGSSKASEPDPNPTSALDKSPPRPNSPSSFNLRSFRHVRSPSPNEPNTSLVIPPARPRGPSANSDSSQRISVAAFREAQARRSTAGSPVPSFRSPSPSIPPHVFPPDGQRERASPRPQRSSPQILSRDQKRRSSSFVVEDTSDTDESLSSEEASDDGMGGIRRNGTITQRTRPLIGKRQAKSEIGHGGSYDRSSRKNANFLTTRSQLGHGQVDTNVRQSSYVGNTSASLAEALPPRSQSSLGVYGNRPRASASTSALSPSAAAKRASILAKANDGSNQDPLAALKQTTRHFRDSSTYSNPSQPTKKPVDSDTSEPESGEDNAPLASLVPPRRPGSAMSSASNTSLRTNGTRGPGPVRGASKPLIDISELTLRKPSVGPYKDDGDGFTMGGLLAGRSANQSPLTVESPTLMSPPSPTIVTNKPPPGFTNFIPPTSPPKEVQAYINLDSKLSSTPTSTSPAMWKETSPERRRDIIGERLARLAKGKERETEDSDLKGGKSMNSALASPRSPPIADSPPRQSIVKQDGDAKAAGFIKLPLSGILKPSPPDKELIDAVDDSILRLISRTGDSDPEATSGSESDSRYGKPEETEKADVDKPSAQGRLVEVEALSPSNQVNDRIAPIPIKQRAPPPAFSVMSRPPLQKPLELSGIRGGSIDISDSVSPTIGSPSSSGRAESPPIPSPKLARPRSSTLIPSSTSSFGTSTSSFAKISSRAGSNSASSVTVPNSNGSSTNISVASPRTNSPNMDRANALKTVANANGRAMPLALSSNSCIQQSQARQRSSTLIPMLSGSTQNKSATIAPVMPTKPFAVRRDSPASSTGDSSSGRAPSTPKDGSDIGAPSSKKEGKKEEWSSGVSGLGTSSTKGGAKYGKRRSVSFDDDVKDETSRREAEPGDPEARRRERRRSEAKAAIELGNVINGPGPVVSDDEDDLPINQAMHARMPAMNPMMGMGNPMQLQVPFIGNGGLHGWPGMAAPQMLSPAQFMVPPPPDPSFLAAHQQAMMIAKQAYQMAVAQHAMAAAADEWDRNSVMGGSVYGGSSNASAMMGPPLGMMGMGGVGNGWSTGSMIFPNNPRPMFGGGISSSRSEYGGSNALSGMGGGGNWSSARSTHGESFGPSGRLRPGMGGGNRNSGLMRDSGYFPPVPPIPTSQSSGSSSINSANARGRGRTSSQPASPGRSALRKAPPPSSWKAGV